MDRLERGAKERMSDIEVGKLWMVNRIPTSKADELHLLQQEAICDLIRKLVEERAWGYSAYAFPARVGTVPYHFVMLALQDFGIPPEDWK